jgi:hypothetical protein
MHDTQDDLTVTLVEIDITPKEWPKIIRSRLAFGLVVTYIMTYAPRRVVITPDKMLVKVPETMVHLWHQWTMRLHRQCEKLLITADRLDGSLTQLTQFLEGEWIP